MKGFLVTAQNQIILSDKRKIKFIEIFTRSSPVCSYCQAAKKLLKDNLSDIPLIEYDLNKDTAKFSELRTRYPAVKNVPQILITMNNGSRWHIGGYYELLQGFPEAVLSRA